MAKKKPVFGEPTLEELDPRLLDGLAKAEAHVEEVEARNAGKPRAGEVMRKNLDVTLSFRMGARDRRALDLLAEREGLKTGDLARELLLAGLNERLRQEEALARTARGLSEVEIKALGAVLESLQDQFHVLNTVSASTERFVSSILKQAKPKQNRAKSRA